MTRARPLFAGVDAGTSACKAVLLDLGAGVVATTWQPYSTRRTSAGEVTQDARDWLRAVELALRELVTRATNRGEIVGIGLTAPAHNVVLVDDTGEPLAPVILWSDTRPAHVANDLEASIGSLIRERAFVRLGPACSLSQLVWLQREVPGLWPRISKVLPGKDFIRWAMTGTAATDPTDAAGMAMYDSGAEGWIEEALAAAGLDPSTMPEVAGAATVGGTLNGAWAQATGIKRGTPVAVGATDTAAELVSLGASHAGASLAKIASTGTIVVVSGRPYPDPRVLTYPHALPGLWYTVAATNTAATAYTWLREALFESDGAEPARLYAAMDAIAVGVDPGAGGVLFLPFLDGERTPFWDADLRGAFLGLATWHSRPHLCRAVLEGVALSLRSCRDVLREIGLSVECPQLAGGGTASEIWTEILVSILGEPAAMTEPQGPALGAAMLAAQSTGATPGRPGYVRTETLVPRSDWAPLYDDVYSVYRLACEAMKRLSKDLGRLSTPLSKRAGVPV